MAARSGAWRSAKGLYYEGLTLAWLRTRGLRLVQRNYRCRLGEIDLVMLDRDTLVFVEVRFRDSASHGAASATVDGAKQRRILRAAQHFLQHHAAHAHRICRFDVVGVSGSRWPFRAEWIRHAFQQGE